MTEPLTHPGVRCLTSPWLSYLTRKTGQLHLLHMASLRLTEVTCETLRGHLTNAKYSPRLAMMSLPLTPGWGQGAQLSVQMNRRETESPEQNKSCVHLCMPMPGLGEQVSLAGFTLHSHSCMPTDGRARSRGSFNSPTPLFV